MPPLGHGSHLRVRRAEMIYSIPRDYTEVSRIRAQLDHVARAELVASLRASVRNVAQDDPSLWFVRKMEVSVAVNAAWNHEQIADAWSERIQTAVQSTISRGEETETVVRFGDEAEYLRRFLLDLVHGTAWSKWYYRRFEGLNALPASGVMRSLFVMHPEQGRLALVGMSQGELSSVVETLTAADAKRSARALADSNSTDDARDAALLALEAAASRCTPETCAERVALYACVEYARGGQHPNITFFEVSVALARLRTLLRASAAGQSQLLDAIALNNISEIVRIASLADAELLAALMNTSRSWLQTAAERLTKEPASNENTDGLAGPRYSSFGGLFLLLPLLAATDFESRVAAWAPCDRTSASALLRFLVALAAGSGNVPRDWYDAVARDVLGVYPTLSVERVRAWCTDIPIAQWRELLDGGHSDSVPAGDTEFLTLPTELAGKSEVAAVIAALASKLLRRFALMLPGFSASSASHLFVNFLDVRVSLEDEPARRVVRRSRPPLDLVLRMAGLGQGTVRIPWDARPVAVFPENAE